MIKKKMNHNHKKNQENGNFIISKALLPDIACTSCAGVIEGHFKKLNDIEISINFATKKMQFKYNPKLWNETKIKKAMHQLGYDIANFETQNQVIEYDHTHDYDQHLEHMAEKHQHVYQHQIKLCALIELIIGWVLLMPLLLMMIPGISFLDGLRNPYVQLGLTIPIQFYFGRKFYLGIIRELIKQKWPGMNTLIAFGTNTAFCFSIYLMIVNQTEHLFFEVSASIIMIVLLGDLISDFVQTKATSGLANLMNLKPKLVLKYDLKTKQEQFINIEKVQLNDLLIVRKGEAIPTDGILISKKAFINEAMLTGEIQAINKVSNETLIGGTINLGDSFQMRTTKIGKDTVLANIISAVEDAQAQKPKLQKLADKIAGIFTPMVILIAIFVFIIRFYIINDTLTQAITITISTLIIACPCALGIATPLAVAVGINKAAKIGIIYNKAAAFDKITKIDTICFDKTGTLTTGKMVITKIYGEKDNINKAIALENHSTHPLALAFSLYQTSHQIKKLPIIKEIKEIIGFGLQGTYQNQLLEIAAYSTFEQLKLPLSEQLKTLNLQDQLAKGTLIALAINKTITNIFVLADELQTNALLTIKKLQKQGINVVLISGDHESQTALIAKKVGISTYFANVKPIAKAAIVKDLQLQGQKVAFVGDGINDIVALEQADLAIAMGSGSDIAKKIGDITIAVADISAVYKAIILTKKTKNNIWMNFIWAFSYNIIIIPLATLGFIIPTLAAVAMAFSDITVVVNSLIFKWRKYKY